MKISAQISQLLSSAFSAENVCAEDHIRILRLLIEWLYVGQPDSKRDEFISCMLPDLSECRVDLQELTSGALSQHDLDAIIAYVLSAYFKKEPNYIWVPYILKAVFSHPAIVGVYPEIVDAAWPDNEDLTEKIVQQIYNRFINKDVEDRLFDISLNAKRRSLREMAKSKI